MNFEELLSTEKPKPSRRSEANFWKAIRTAAKQQLPGYSFTRLESWATLGVPDVLVCDDLGVFHLIELKSITGYASQLSPHQIGFFTRHALANAWVFILQNHKSKPSQMFVYHASQVLELSEKGLRLEPFGVWEFAGLDWVGVWEKMKARRGGRSC